MPSRGKIGLRIQAEILAVIDNVQTYPARSPLVDILDLRTAAPVAMILASTKRGLTTDGVALLFRLDDGGDQRRRRQVDEPG